jgi:hypothetical protein
VRQHIKRNKFCCAFSLEGYFKATRNNSCWSSGESAFDLEGYLSLAVKQTVTALVGHLAGECAFSLEGYHLLHNKP